MCLPGLFPPFCLCLSELLIGMFLYAFSIYKAVLKSKGSINEVNQIAQVFFICWTIICTHFFMILVSSFMFSEWHIALFGCTAADYHKTKAMCWSRASLHSAAGECIFLTPNPMKFVCNVAYFHCCKYTDILPCSRLSPWNMDSYSEIGMPSFPFIWLS